MPWNSETKEMEKDVKERRRLSKNLDETVLGYAKGFSGRNEDRFITSYSIQFTGS